MANNDATGGFTARLELILKALSLTRGRLAAELSFQANDGTNYKCN